jgi:hypothetical protein
LGSEGAARVAAASEIDTVIRVAVAETPASRADMALAMYEQLRYLNDTTDQIAGRLGSLEREAREGVKGLGRVEKGVGAVAEGLGRLGEGGKQPRGAGGKFVPRRNTSGGGAGGGEEEGEEEVLRHPLLDD